MCRRANKLWAGPRWNWWSKKDYELEIVKHTLHTTARSLDDETRNGERNANRNPECWGDLSQLQIQIKQKSQLEFVPWDTSEFKSNQNLNLTLNCEIPRNLIFSILTSWLKSPQHSGFRFAFLSTFRVSSCKERAVSFSKRTDFTSVSVGPENLACGLFWVDSTTKLSKVRKSCLGDLNTIKLSKPYGSVSSVQLTRTCLHTPAWQELLQDIQATLSCGMEKPWNTTKNTRGCRVRPGVSTWI